MPDLLEALEQCFKGRVCLMGLGNRDCGDDGLGVVLSEKIEDRLKMQGNMSVAHGIISAGTMPERFIKTTTKRGFNHIIFLDAVEFGGSPGSVVFLNSGEIIERFPQISTHRMSLGLMAKWIEHEGATRAWLLGIQPGSLKTSGGLTQEVQTTLEILEELLGNLWISGN